MKDKPYPITGHAAYYEYRYNPFIDFRERFSPAPLLAPKRVVKRAKKKKKAL